MATADVNSQHQFGPAHRRPVDLIESKFNELAKKILDELEQVQYSNEFFKVIDGIIKEPSESKFHNRGSKRSISRQSTRSQQAQASSDANQTQANVGAKPIRSLPSEVKQHQQQRQPQTAADQLTGHQQQVAAQAARDKEAPAAPRDRQDTCSTDKTQTQQIQRQQSLIRQRSAIPTSTVLSGAKQMDQAAGRQTFYPISKSATVGDTYAASRARTSLSAGTSPTNNKPNNVVVGGGKQMASARSLNHHKVAASEKIQKRRPTRAVLDANDIEFLRGSNKPDTDEDYDDDDEFGDGPDDDDDDEDPLRQHTNLLANRANLNQRFIANALADPRRKPNPIVRSQTIGGTTSQSLYRQSQQVGGQQRKSPFLHPNDKLQSQPRVSQLAPTSQTVFQPSISQQQQQEPRLLGHLYKPHMNYSTNASGNHHRLSDDDEIIIIPTQSPSSFAGSISPDCQGQQQHNEQNLDDLSERFSISRTKSFWEKLSSAKVGAGPGASKGFDDGVSQQQQYNIIHSMMQANPDIKADEHKQLAGSAKSPVAKIGSQNFDRMDSTGGSNSNYSNCSSSSGDEQLHSNLVTANNNNIVIQQLKRANTGGQSHSLTSRADHQQPPQPLYHPTVSQLQREEMSRQNIFRQTR